MARRRRHATYSTRIFVTAHNRPWYMYMVTWIKLTIFFLWWGSHNHLQVNHRRCRNDILGQIIRLLNNSVYKSSAVSSLSYSRGFNKLLRKPKTRSESYIVKETYFYASVMPVFPIPLLQRYIQAHEKP